MIKGTKTPTIVELNCSSFVTALFINICTEHPAFSEIYSLWNKQKNKWNKLLIKISVHATISGYYNNCIYNYLCQNSQSSQSWFLILWILYGKNQGCIIRLVTLKGLAPMHGKMSSP